LCEASASRGWIFAGGREPISVQLVGEPGVGKSAIIYPLMAYLTKFMDVRVDEKTNFKDYIYDLPKTSDHMDGYSGQLGVLMDDVFQRKDSPSLPNPELMMFLQMINVAKFIVPMAHLSSKGTVFDSRIVFLTTNREHYQIRSMEEPTAIWRRIHYRLRTKVIPEVQYNPKSNNPADHGICPTNLAKWCESQGFVYQRGIVYPQIYRFDVLVECHNPRTIAENVSYEYVFKMLRDAVIRQNEKMENSTKQLHEFANLKFDDDGIDEAPTCLKPGVCDKPIVVDGKEDFPYHPPSLIPAKVVDVSGRINITAAKSYVCDDVAAAAREFESTYGFEAGLSEKARRAHVLETLKSDAANLDATFARIDFKKAADAEFQALDPKELPATTSSKYLPSWIDPRTMDMKKWFEGRSTEDEEERFFDCADITGSLDKIERAKANLETRQKLKKYFQYFTVGAAVMTIGGVIARWFCGVAKEQEEKEIVEESRSYGERGPANTIRREGYSGKDVVNNQIRREALAEEEGLADWFGRKWQTMLMALYGDQMKKYIDQLWESRKVPIVKKMMMLAHCDHKEFFFQVRHLCDDRPNDPDVCEIFKHPIACVVMTRGILYSDEEIKATFRNAVKKHMAPEDREFYEAVCADVILQSSYEELNKAVSRTVDKNVVSLPTYSSLLSVNKEPRVDSDLLKEPNLAIPEMPYDMNAWSLVRHRLMYNTLLMKKENGGVMNAFSIGGQCVVTNAHACEWMKGSEKLTFTCVNQSFEVFVSDLQTKILDDDVMIMYSDRFPRFRRVTDQLMSEDEVAKSPMNRMLMVRYAETPKKGDMIVLSSGVSRYYTGKELNFAKPGSSEVKKTVNRYVKYSMDTVYGDCGAPIVNLDPRSAHKICAIHAFTMCSGVPELLMNGGVMVTREMISAGMADIPKQYWPDMPSAPVAKVVDGAAALQCSIEPRYLPNRTNFIKNPDADDLAKKIGTVVKTKPAYLHPVTINDERIDPLVKGLRKVLRPNHAVDPKDIDDLREFLTGHLLQNYSGSKRKGRILSPHESIFGSEEVEPLDLSTSPGFGWKPLPGKTGKTTWFDAENGTIHPDFIEVYNAKMSAYRSGSVAFPTIFSATLKDERRPIEKVEQGKTRIFFAGPQDFSVMFRVFFLDFMNFLQDNRIYNGIAVGINALGPEWTDMYKYLRSFSPTVLAGDFENFDGTNALAFQDLFVDVANAFYDDEHDEMRWRLWRDVTHANVALRDTVISLGHGMASGCPATAVANSVYNLSVCFYSAAKIIQETDVCTFAQALNKVRDVVRPVTYGDDSVIAVAESVPYDFNQFSAKMKDIGMTYTSEDKSGPARLKPLTEATFLKRGFQVQWGAFRLGHIEKQTIHELFFWHRDHLEHDTQIVTNIENGLRELSMWNDQAEYDRVVKIVRKYCLQFRLQPRIQTMVRNIEEAMGMQVAYYQCSVPRRCPCPHGSMCLYGCPQCAEDEMHEDALFGLDVHPGGRRFWNEVDPWLHASPEFRSVMIDVIERCDIIGPSLTNRLRMNIQNGRNLDSVFDYREQALCRDDFPRLRVVEKNVLVERDFQKYVTHFYFCMNEDERACIVFRTFPVFGSIAEMEQE
jgi:hypothetical protein